MNIKIELDSVNDALSTFNKDMIVGVYQSAKSKFLKK